MFDALLDDRARHRPDRSAARVSIVNVSTASLRQRQPALICLQPTPATQQSQQ
jgi:hypothetical protein